MKKEIKQVRSFHGTDATWSVFQINCRVLGLTQSDVLEGLIKAWNVQQKDTVNKIISLCLSDSFPNSFKINNGRDA